MIDREKVIKKLAVRIQSDSEEWNTIELPIEEANDILALMKEQEEEIENIKQTAQSMMEGICLLKEQNWVKCSDRMPEERDGIFAKFKGTDKWSAAMFAQGSEDVRVVIVFADGTRRVSHSYTIDGKWECEKNPIKRIVTHWMPNPKLPKEDR